jgi:type I restriction enzyme S subunit
MSNADSSKWGSTTLKAITTKIGSGATPRGGKESYADSGIALIRSLNVYPLVFEYEGLARINDAQAEELANVEVRADDVLLNITGASVTRCCMVPNAILPARVNQHVAIVRIDEALADARYVMYCLNSPRYKGHLLTLAQGGATREALTKEKIEGFRIPYPKVTTQRKIGMILGAYDKLIENNVCRIRILEDMAGAIYREWFVEFRAPGLKIRRATAAEKKATGADVFPEGWGVRVLGELAVNFDARRRPLSSMERADMKGPYPYYGAAKVVDYINDYIFDGRYLLVAEDGSVITDDRKPVLQVATGKFWVNNHTHVLQGRSPVSTNLLYMALREVDIAGFITGAAQPKITQANLNRIPVVLAEEPVLRAFDEMVGHLLAQVDVLISKNRNLRQTRDLLLPRLISGGVNVENLEGTKSALPEAAGVSKQ